MELPGFGATSKRNRKYSNDADFPVQYITRGNNFSLYPAQWRDDDEPWLDTGGWVERGTRPLIVTPKVVTPPRPGCWSRCYNNEVRKCNRGPLIDSERCRRKAVRKCNNKCIIM